MTSYVDTAYAYDDDDDSKVDFPTTQVNDTKLFIYRTQDTVPKKTTRLRRFASCRTDEDILLKGNFANMTAVELLSWVEDGEGVEFGQIRVVETGLVGYIKARHLHTEEKAQALAAKKQTKRLSFAKAKSSDNKDKNIKWDVIKREMADILDSLGEVSYVDFQSALVKKYGQATFEKHKKNFENQLKELTKQLEEAKVAKPADVIKPTTPENREVKEPEVGPKPVSTPESPIAKKPPRPPLHIAYSCPTPTAKKPPRPPLHIAHSAEKPQRRSVGRRMSVSSRAQQKMESILSTPAGMVMLQNQAAASGRDIDACREILIRAVRHAAVTKQNLKRLSAQVNTGVRRRVATVAGPTASETSLPPATKATLHIAPRHTVSHPGHRRQRSHSDAGAIAALSRPSDKYSSLRSSGLRSSLPSGGLKAEMLADSPTHGFSRTRLIEKAIRRFNLNVKMGVKELREIIGHDAKKLGNFLRVTKGLNKEHVGEVLGMHQEYYLAVLDGYVSGYEFKGLEYKLALRQFLNSFRLPGEAQKIERIVATFAKYFSRANPTSALKNQDTVFLVSYAVLMLNTSLHSPKVKASDRITKEDFIKMLKGHDIPDAELSDIFDHIKSQELLNKKERCDVSGTLFNNPKLAGPMRKASERQLLYQKRWMMLTQENQLFYFKNKDGVNPLGFIELSSARMKVKDGRIKLVPAKGEKQVKSMKIHKDKRKPAELGKHDFIYLKVPKVDVDKHPDYPTFDDWVAAIAAICNSPATDEAVPDDTNAYS